MTRHLFGLNLVMTRLSVWRGSAAIGGASRTIRPCSSGALGGELVAHDPALLVRRARRRARRARSGPARSGALGGQRVAHDPVLLDQVRRRVALGRARAPGAA